jgi:tagatose-1,6-bisphosphate aldolase non-catalytic subunit AgaZ/GatZ
MVCEFGENEQLEPDGPTQVKLMVLLKPFKGAMVMLKTAVLPWTTETPVESGVRAKSAVVEGALLPVPERETEPLDELEVTARVADSASSAVGANLT